MTLNIILLIVGILVGICTPMLILRDQKIDLHKVRAKAQEKVSASQEDAQKLLEEARRKISDRKSTMEDNFQRRTRRNTQVQESLKKREETINKRSGRNNEIKLTIASEEESLQGLQNSVTQMENDFTSKLAEKTGLSRDSLSKDIIKEYEHSLIEFNKERLSSLEEYYKENANKIAVRILQNVIQRLCTDTSVETRAVHVKVPKDHIKGKIVGKGAKNVQLLEEMLDVDIIFNDLPQTISISAFNLVQRRIAQKTIEKLCHVRGEINANIIKKNIEQAEKETDKELYQIGKKAVDRMGFKDFDPELIRIVGRLQYRTSYGQNIMKHSMEVGWVAAMIGAELGLDEKVCRVAGFLHDLGKAIDQDPEITDPHDLLSKKLMEKYGFSWEEVHAAWTHHDAIPQETAEALIIKAADAVSAGRPGARQESIDRYIERLRALEQTVKSFSGIKTTYAISAGREVRVIVDNKTHDDQGIGVLAQDIAGKIEENVTYPGKIKVNVIRRTKNIEIAK